MLKPYYDHGGITIFHGRCEDVLPTLPAGSIDAVICDPPYGTTACAWDTPIDFGFMWRELKRLTKRNAAIVLFGSQPFTSALVMSNPGMFRYELVWDKIQTGAPGVVKFRPLPVHETISVFAEGPTTYNPILHHGDPYRSTTRNGGNRHGFGFKGKYYVALNTGFRYQTSIVSKAKERHPYHETQKPVDLLCDLIGMYTNPGDTVLDFCAGSGTTGAAAKKLSRQCIQVEQEAEYVDVAISRLQQEVMDFALAGERRAGSE